MMTNSKSFLKLFATLSVLLFAFQSQAKPQSPAGKANRANQTLASYKNLGAIIEALPKRVSQSEVQKLKSVLKKHKVSLSKTIVPGKLKGSTIRLQELRAKFEKNGKVSFNGKSFSIRSKSLPIFVDEVLTKLTSKGKASANYGLIPKAHAVGPLFYLVAAAFVVWLEDEASDRKRESVTKREQIRNLIISKRTNLISCSPNGIHLSVDEENYVIPFATISNFIGEKKTITTCTPELIKKVHDTANTVPQGAQKFEVEPDTAQ